jgi:DHA2 family multidrug resistance protein-like MFS transporter
MKAPGRPGDPVQPASGPVRHWWGLSALVSVAAVANLNLAVANVALPDIGLQFRASQAELNLVSVGFSLGLAGTVLYLGAVGDRYGRKRMLVLGMAATVPTAFLAAWATSIGVLIVARVLGGVAAGMAFPPRSP